MNKNVLLFAFLFSVASFAQSPSLSREQAREQAQMRDLARRSSQIYADLQKEIDPKFEKERKSFSYDTIRQQYEGALQKIHNTEGSIRIQKSNSGKSLIWASRKRQADYEPIQSAVMFYSGPEDDVNLYSGEFLQTATDMSYPLRGGVGFAFHRYYSSQTNYSGALGDGWDFSYNSHLLFDKETPAESGEASLFLNGKKISFSKRGSEWQSDAGSFLRLSYESGMYCVYDSQLKRMEFEPSEETKTGWRLKAIASRHAQYSANRVSISYQDDSDRIESITEPYGNIIHVCYDPSGRIVQIASSNQSVSYSYDNMGCLSTVSCADSAINLEEKNGYAVHYGYTRVSGRSLLTSRRINDSSAFYSIAYDPSGRVSEAGYQSQDLKALWSFQRNGNVITVTPAQPAVSVNYVFNSPNCVDLPSEIRTPALDSIETFVYNNDGLVVAHLDPVGVKSVREYDSDNPLPELRANVLRETVFPSENASDAIGMIVTETSYRKGTSFPARIVLYENDEKNVLSVEEYEYSEDNCDLICKTDNGISTRYLCNKYGETAIVLDANNNAIINKYATTWPTEPRWDFTEGAVNGGGLLVSVFLDAEKEKLDEACSVLGVKKYQHSDIGRVRPVSMKKQYAYNEHGQIIHSKDGTKESFYLFNRKGDTLATWEPQEGNTIISLSHLFLPQEIYHQFSPGESQSFKGGTSFHFSGNYYKETISRDSLNRIISVSQTDEKFNGKPAVYTYSRYPNGTLWTITEPNGMTRVDEYGNNGLLQRQYLRNGESVVELNKVYEYFQNGSIRKFIDAYGEENTNGLDCYGRLAVTTDSMGIKTSTLYDGAERVVAVRAEKDGKTISRKDYTYNKNGLLSAVYEHRISDKINEKVLIQQLEYDNSGNVIATRGIHEKSWQYFLYDGLNRSVVHKQPSGDYTFVVYDDDQVAMKQQLVHEDNDKNRRVSQYFVRDIIGNPVVSIPIDTELHPQYDRLVVSTYDVRGSVVSMRRPNLNMTVHEYNTLGQIVREKTIPQSNDYGEKDVVAEYSYAPNGSVLSKRVENTPLAITGRQDDARAVLLNSPQITIYTYDSLGREQSIRQPDGLIIEKKYNANSMPTEMIWKHATGQDILRHLHLEFGKQGRLISISDAKNGKILREFQYDDYGNRSTEIDGEVTISRKFDSMGLLLSEQTSVGQKKLPGFSMDYSLKDGSETQIWNDMPVQSGNNWNAQTVVRDADNRVIAMRLNQSTVDFATWKYLGVLEYERYIPESHITQRNFFNSRNELSKTSFFENADVFGELSYLYDSFGNEIYSSTSLAKKQYTHAQYMGYNSMQQIVAQNSEINLPSPGNALARRDQVLGTASLQSQKTSRMAYDQVDNIWAHYQGHNVSTPTPDAFTTRNLSSFFSPAKVLSGGSPFNEEAMFELASNRETTRATFTDSKLTAEENEYDKLGNLVKYKGEFWNKNRSLDVVWNLTFDALGRLVYMQGFAESDTPPVLKKGQCAAELHFKYDADNRRIYKKVIDHSRSEKTFVSSEWTIYTENSQSLVLRDDEKNTIIGQYLWKPDSRELLMAAIEQDVAENNADYRTERYYFQQDRGLNTICVTKTENGNVTLVSAASYMSFGNNATMAKIKSIESSMSSSNDSLAFNNSLEDSAAPAIWTWRGQSARPHYMTINLAEKSVLSSLNVWTDSFFPRTFYVFVLPPNIDSPLLSFSEYITKNAEYLAYINKSSGPAVATKPLHIPLQNLSGNRIVLMWDAEEGNEVHINELEVGRIPDNPGAIAFAGQWLDRETNLYYQINRYRLAGSNKFISPDPIGFLDGDNLYAYARNNPLSWHDPNGEWVQILAGAGIGAIVGGGMYAIDCWISGNDFSWAEFGISALAGATSGALLSCGIAINPVALGALAFGAGGAIESGGITYYRTGDIGDSLLASAEGAAWGAAAGALFGGLGGFGKSAGFLKTVGISSLSSATIGGARSGVYEFISSGELSSAARSALNGGARGALSGAIAGAGVYAVGKVTQALTPSPKAKVSSSQNHSETHHPDSTYNRPSGYRKGVRDAVWNSAIEKSTGRVRDPLTGRFMPKDAPWDMGHKPGYEWRKFRNWAKEHNLSRKQVLDWNNDPNHFRPELPSSNRSHAAEDLTSAFFGGF